MHNSLVEITHTTNNQDGMFRVFRYGGRQRGSTLTRLGLPWPFPWATGPTLFPASDPRRLVHVMVHTAPTSPAPPLPLDGTGERGNKVVHGDSAAAKPPQNPLLRFVPLPDRQGVARRRGKALSPLNMHLACGGGRTKYRGGFRADFVGSKTSQYARIPLPTPRQGDWEGNSTPHPFSK